MLFSLAGCKGCSQSGLRHQAQQQEVSQEDNNFNRTAESSESVNVQEPADRELDSSDRSLNTLFKKYRSAVFMVYTSDNEKTYQGSGFFINSNGLALSNYHVFKGTQKGSEVIETESGEYKISKVIEHNEEKDYIIFQVGNLSGNNYLEISNVMPEIGEEVWAISNPRGLSHTLTTGIVSGYRDDQYIQMTTEITHGSSGGALMDMNGKVVGITTMGVGEANLNFAVKINEIQLGRFID